MNREIKFRAWVPAFKTMLTEIDVCANGMIGMTDSRFTLQLNKGYEWNGEEVTRGLDYHGVIGGETVAVPLTGYEYLWIDEGNFDLMQFTGLCDKNGVEIYEGDIVRYMVPGFDAASNDEFTEVVEWQGAGFQVEVIPLYAAVDFGYSEVIGNIHQHSHLLS